MTSQRLAVPELVRVFEGESISGLSEWQLLERYIESRDEAAFEALVTRHGPMVLGVCRRVLGYSPDAEDAFQATFLILVRRARDLGPKDAIGPWLYGVATRVAARARCQATRRRRYEAMPLERPVPDRQDATVDPDLVDILDTELSRLPEKYRSPLVLCYLEGRTHEEAARDLQWPVGTVKGRLARARDLLRSRLARRGFAPSAGIAGVFSSPDLRMILDRSLVERTVGASGQLVTQVVSQSITALVEGVLGTMFYRKITLAMLAAVVTGFAFATAAVLGRPDAQPGAEGPAEQATTDSSPEGSPQPRLIAQGKRERLPDAVSLKSGGRRKKRADVESTEPDDARASDPKSRAILEKLEEPVSMSFANETPLDDVLKYIKQATTTKTYNGIPIYVDPIGLQEAERSINSTIQIDLEGVPLRRTLQLLLSQLDLVYFVDDGILVITCEDSETNDGLPPAMRTPTPILARAKQAERGEMGVAEMKELIEQFKLREQVMQLASGQEIAGHQGEHAKSVGTAKPGSDETAALIKELRELIQLLKAERRGDSREKEQKPAEAK